MIVRRLVPVIALFAASAVLVSAVSVVGGCSEAAPTGPDLSSELSAISSSLEASRESSERLATEVQRQGRRIGDLSRRVDELGAMSPVAAAHAPAEGTAGAAAMGNGAAPGTVATDAVASEVAAVLASDDGRKVIAAAARGAIAESEVRQRDAFVAYSLAKFAEEARLSDTQARDVRKAWDDVMADARKLVRDAAPTPDMTPEERAEKVKLIGVGMRELGTRREEQMRAILDDAQYALYEQRQDDIDAGLHGRPPTERRTTEGDETPQR